MTIAPNGAVEGTVGGAKMREAKFRPRAAHELKAMNHYEYRVDLRLAGEIAPGVSRESARILLNWRDGHWEGWIVTSGSLFGGKGSIQVQAVDMVMKRPAGR
jgi:hypothetical protein